MTNVTNIPAPRVDLIDPRTGLMSREWYRFFLNLFQSTGGGQYNVTPQDMLLAGTDPAASFLGQLQDARLASVPLADYGQALQDIGLGGRQSGATLEGIASLSSRVAGLEMAPASEVAFERIPARGCMRKTTTQVVGALTTTFVPIVNFQGSIFPKPDGITLDLVNGVFSVQNAGDYFLDVNLEVECTPDNNSSRKMTVRLFDVTDGLAVPNMDAYQYIGSYAAGFSTAISIPFHLNVDSTGINFRVELNGVSNFVGVNILRASIAVTSVDNMISS